jgi:hypothetical protein
LARQIVAEGEYMPSHEEWIDLCKLENAGLVGMGSWFHPVGATWRITDRGEKWLEENA